MAHSGLPYCRWRLTGWSLKATVVNVAADGKITRKFDDPDGKVMSFVTTAFEFEDHLYLGTLNNNFIGKLKLNPTNS
ncbi:ABC TRANSPORTER PERMEASE PROTEIN-LIKE PROTEIN [Salix purpurea]|uniref:ABC TRANSPORTER PERMEASE PROTEIN-LIKE PROTEIN n=1 Tax=Salix purpurea TaxID=77065 RepID=A0A9Q0Q3C3_SALPP|nr:ABC TRANSPORTER PERMEASE PROTEIN-LIKE PROTEIN [Salix purpurea]